MPDEQVMDQGVWQREERPREVHHDGARGVHRTAADGSADVGE